MIISYPHIKRMTDILISLMGLLILSPILTIIALLVKMTSSGPVIFRQERIGLAGKPFLLFKFRTMVRSAEQTGKLITVQGDTRITRVGKFLRKYKLDEFPQLINVLRGDMSLVGPRPEVIQYVKMYSKEQLKVLSIRPGITDYASIAFSDENYLLSLSNNPEETYIKKIMPRKLSLNLKYISEMSFTQDLKLILLTLKKIFWPKKRG